MSAYESGAQPNDCAARRIAPLSGFVALCQGGAMPRANPLFADMGTTIFTVMSALALEHKAINLGQGFPDEDGPAAIREAASKALMDGPNQYAPMRGLPVLRQALAAHARQFHGLDFNPDTDIVVTSGGTEALAAAIVGLANPGNEAIVIEPAYDSYRPMLEAAGATVRGLRLQPPDWRLTEEALAAAFTPKTKVVMLNTPHNPVGRVFTREELELLAKFIQRHDAVAICDEVYEHLTFDGRPHVSLLHLPGMRERAVRIGSAGKMFSLTGWKIGWAMGEGNLIRAVANAHQFITFATSPALQMGVAHGLAHEMAFTLELTSQLQEKRDILSRALTKVGFNVLPCQGTYFLTADISKLTNESDRAFSERLTKEAGVASVPLSVFFGPVGPQHLVRFAFCKKREVLEEAGRRLEKHFVG
jgi:aspartate/methionine/tyrosine aminotransferase